MDHTDDSVGDRIRRSRKAKRLTQAELGARLGVSQVAVSEWERGTTFPSNLKGLQRELGINPDDIVAYFTGDDAVEKAILRQTRLPRPTRDALVTIYRQLLDANSGRDFGLPYGSDGGAPDSDGDDDGGGVRALLPDG